jgi:hypothetical protein
LTQNIEIDGLRDDEAPRVAKQCINELITTTLLAAFSWLT